MSRDERERDSEFSLVQLASLETEGRRKEVRERAGEFGNTRGKGRSQEEVSEGLGEVVHWTVEYTSLFEV